MALMTSIAYNTRALLLKVWPADQHHQHHLGARWNSRALCPTPDLLDLHFDEIQVTCAQCRLRSPALERTATWPVAC